MPSYRNQLLFHLAAATQKHTHTLAAIQLFQSALEDSVDKNFHSEQIVNLRGYLGPARVLGPAPNVRFLLLSPIATEKNPIIYYFLLRCCHSYTLA